MENKFKLGQRVIEKNMPVECAFEIGKITLFEGDIYYGHWEGDSLSVKESNLELVKEKRKVTLFAPIISLDGKIELGYFSSSMIESHLVEGKIVGWHSISVEIDE